MTHPKQLHLNVKLDLSVTLENFISCPSTKLVLKASNNFICNKLEFRTLYLWGRDGVGKNYLMNAVNQKCMEEKLSSAFLSFSNTYRQGPSIFEELEKLDVIFLEGLEKYPVGEEWEVALFNLINSSLSKGTRMFFTSNLVAKNLSIKLDDLRSRIVAFPAFELPEITEEEKLTALEESAKRKGLVFEDRVLVYILNHTSRSLADLLKLMFDLDTYSLEKKRKISIPLVKELLTKRANSQDT